jgi:hypothetical protein
VLKKRKKKLVIFRKQHPIKCNLVILIAQKNELAIYFCVGINKYEIQINIHKTQKKENNYNKINESTVVGGGGYNLYFIYIYVCKKTKRYLQ